MVDIFKKKKRVFPLKHSPNKFDLCNKCGHTFPKCPFCEGSLYYLGDHRRYICNKCKKGFKPELFAEMVYVPPSKKQKRLLKKCQWVPSEDVFEMWEKRGYIKIK